MPAPIFPALLMYDIIYMVLTYGTHTHIWLDGIYLYVCVCVYTCANVESKEDGEREMKLI